MIGNSVGLILILVFLNAGISFSAGVFSSLPSNGDSSIPLDNRDYRHHLGEVINGAPLDLLTNRPVSRLWARDSMNLTDSTLYTSHQKKWHSRNWHLIKFQKSDGTSFTLDPRFGFRVDSGKDVTIMRRMSGIEFHGTLKQYFGYYFRFVDNTERGNGPYHNRDQLIEDHYGYVGPFMGGKETYYDATEAYLNWGNDWINVTLGKDRVSWGPGQRTNLLLSDNTPSFDQLRVKARLGETSQFTYLVGKLHPPADLVGDTLYKTSLGWTRIKTESKWIAAHRLEYTPLPWLLLSVSEAIIWGERALDFGYLNPLYFLYSAQHDGGDRDNVAMSGDFVARLPMKGIFYGALLIDDLKITKLGQGHAGNKLGLLTGIVATDVFDSNLDLGIEYTRLEPFVYSHFFPINRYTHWNSALGADLLPNSDRIELTARYTPQFDVTINLSIANNRHGSVGGTIKESLPRGLVEKVHFLEGTQTTWHSLDLGVEWEVIPGGVIELGIIQGDRQAISQDRWYVSIGYKI